MEVTFGKEYLRELYQTGKTYNKKYRFQPAIINKYVQVIKLMESQSNVSDLIKYNALHYEKLKGDKLGLSSVRVNSQYRIEFEEKVMNGQTIASICNIVELSNHYK